MNNINLIPAHRVTAARQRACLRRWVIAAGGYAGFLVVMFLVAQSVLLSDEHVVMEELRRLIQRVEHGETQVQGLRSDLLAVNDRIEANRLIGGQPDWGAVLIMIARALGDELVLTSCDLRTADGGGRARTVAKAKFAPDAGSSGVRIELTGLGRSQHAVSEFVLRLEEHPLFDGVTLVSTHREPFHGQFAIGFLMELHVQSRVESEDGGS